MVTNDDDRVIFQVKDCQPIAMEDEDSELSANVEAIEQLVVTTKSLYSRSQERRSSEST